MDCARARARVASRSACACPRVVASRARDARGERKPTRVAPGSSPGRSMVPVLAVAVTAGLTALAYSSALPDDWVNVTVYRTTPINASRPTCTFVWSHDPAARHLYSLLCLCSLVWLSSFLSHLSSLLGIWAASCLYTSRSIQASQTWTVATRVAMHTSVCRS